MGVSVRHLKCFNLEYCQKSKLARGLLQVNYSPRPFEEKKMYNSIWAGRRLRVFAVKLCRRVQECEGRSKSHQSWLMSAGQAGCVEGGRKEAVCKVQVAETLELHSELNCAHIPGIQISDLKRKEKERKKEAVWGTY